MTLVTSLNVVRYLSNGIITEYAYPFKVLDESHLEIIKSDANDTPESRETLALNTDYTVDGVGDDEGGDINLVDPITDGWYLTIARVLPLEQDTDYEQEGEFSLEQIEKDLDMIYMILQQQQEQLDRVPSVSISSGESGQDLLDTLTEYVVDASGSADAAAASADAAETSKDETAQLKSDVESLKTQVEVLLAAANIPSSLTGKQTLALIANINENGYVLNGQVNNVRGDISSSAALGNSVGISAVSKIDSGVYRITFSIEFDSTKYSVFVQTEDPLRTVVVKEGSRCTISFYDDAEVPQNVDFAFLASGFILV